GRRQAADGLRLPCADPVLPGGRHPDDRADRIRIEGGARPLLRRHDRDCRGARRDRQRRTRSGGQSAAPGAAYRHRDRRTVATSLLARAGRIPAALDPPRQGLAGGQAHRQCGWRSPARLHLPADGSLYGQRRDGERPIGERPTGEPGMNDAPRRLALDTLHRELGARMSNFAGFQMPIQYPAGLRAEHLHTRANASLFDVSHMGQLRVTSPDGEAALHAGIEAALPLDFDNWPDGLQRYSLLLNDSGGIADDLMAIRLPGEVRLVVNAGNRDADLAR